jgi:hypothetical protein
MRSLAFTGLGIGFLLMGAGLYVLTLRKPSKPAPANPNKSQLREQAALAEETKKMRLAAAAIAGVGLAMIIFSQL